MDPGLRRDHRFLLLRAFVVKKIEEPMPDRKFGIVIDGATGRLGTTQHLRALLDIRREDGLVLSNGDRLLPEPILLGRNSQKLAVLAEKYGELRWSTDRDAC